MDLENERDRPLRKQPPNIQAPKPLALQRVDLAFEAIDLFSMASNSLLAATLKTKIAAAVQPVLAPRVSRSQAISAVRRHMLVHPAGYVFP